jgi:hypothetical protein
MMMLMMNDTNGTLASEEEQNTLRFYYSVCIVIFFISPMFLFDIFLVVSVFVERAIPVAIRFILCNILAASEVVILGIGMFYMNIIVLSTQQHLLQSECVCRLIFTTLAVGSASRLILMPTFAIVVVILLYQGIAKIRLLPTIVSVVLLWFLSTLPNLVVFSPKIWDFTSITRNSCSSPAPPASPDAGAAAIIYTIVFITVYGICSLLITAVSTIFGIVYIKRNTTSQDRSVMKKMIKLATFLLLGNTISFIGITIPLLIGTFAPLVKRTKELDSAVNLIAAIIHMCSLIPLPVLLLVFFKPIRMRFRRILCFSCYKTISSPSTTSTAGKSNST